MIAFADSPPDTDTDHDSRALTRYLDTIGRTPLLDAEAEHKLARAARAGDESALKTLIESNLRLVVHVASRCRRRRGELRDLIAEGNAGLMRAALTFDADRGGRFANYAIWWIRRHVLRAALDGERMIRMPMHRLAGLATLRRAREAFLEEHGREPRAEELAERTGLSPKLIVSLLAAGRRATSLSTPLGQDDASGATVGDLIADESQGRPDHEFHRREEIREALVQLERLSPRESKVLRLRYGMDGAEPHTCDQIGKIFGLTRERVRQIQDLALRKLRRATAATEAGEFEPLAA